VLLNTGASLRKKVFFRNRCKLLRQKISKICGVSGNENRDDANSPSAFMDASYKSSLKARCSVLLIGAVEEKFQREIESKRYRVAAIAKCFLTLR
jgi:hypothetical protein